MAAEKERGPGSASAEIGKYLEILARDPNSRVFAPLAEAYRKAGLLDDAIETALEGLKVHPNYLGGRVALGRAYFEKKQLVEAAAEMKKVVAAAPDNLMAHKILGQIAYAQNDLASAEKSFKMVLLLDPRDQEAQQFVASIGGGQPAPVRPAAPAATPAPPAPMPPRAPAPSAAVLATPAQPPPPKPATGTVMPPLPMEEIPIPGLSPAGSQPPEPPSLDEIQPLEEFDLAGADMLGDVAPPVSKAPPAAAAPAWAVPPPIDTDLDLSEPEPWLAEAPPAPSAPQPTAARSRPPAPVPDEEMQVEVFSRVPWGSEPPSAAALPPPIPPPPQPATAPETAAEPEDSPFEVFGRPKRGGRPPSSKGESLAFREIEIEHTAHEPVPEAPTPGDEPVFEIFTRTPEPRTPPPPAMAGRGELAGPREIEIETTAFAPYESFEPEQPAAEAGFEIERTAHAVEEKDVRETALELLLENELPRIDLTEAMAEERPEEPPEVPPGHPVRLDEPPAPPADLAPAPWDDGLPEMSLDDEIPNIDLTREVEEERYDEERIEPEPVVEEQAEPVRVEPEQIEPGRFEEEQFEEEPEPAPPEPAPGTARGVFDTETLASIYVSQGFYGRAADIYRRLIAQRPADQELRAKLEDALAREQGLSAAAAVAEPVVAVAPAAAVAPEAAAVSAVAPEPAPEDPKIRQLHNLLEAFRGGRPR